MLCKSLLIVQMFCYFNGEDTLNGVYGHQSAVEIFLFIDPEAEHK